jgi:hypothetical protein
MTIVELLDFIPILKKIPYLLFIFKASLSLGVGVGVGIGVGVGVSVGADCSVCFSGGGVPCSTLPVQRLRGNALCTLEGFSPPQKEEGYLACATMQGRSPLARWRVLPQERECERITARCQHSNGGAILPCMLEVSSTRVVGEECCAACCQRSNTEAIDCSLRFVEFLVFFPILKNLPYLLFVVKAPP